MLHGGGDDEKQSVLVEFDSDVRLISWHSPSELVDLDNAGVTRLANGRLQHPPIHAKSRSAPHSRSVTDGIGPPPYFGQGPWSTHSAVVVVGAVDMVANGSHPAETAGVGAIDSENHFPRMLQQHAVDRVAMLFIRTHMVR